MTAAKLLPTNYVFARIASRNRRNVRYRQYKPIAKPICERNNNRQFPWA